MTYDLQKWRSLLKATSPNDYRFNVKKSPREINIEIIEKSTLTTPKGKANDLGGEPGDAHMRLQQRDDNEFWEVASVTAPEGSSGVGKVLYLLALEVIRDSSAYAGLSPDSIVTSKPAKELWNNFLKKHAYVGTEEKDIDADLEEDDPFKYIWSLKPEWPGVKQEHGVDWTYKSVKEKEKSPETEPEPKPFDPDVDLDDYLEDIDDYPETFEEAADPEDPVKEDFQQNVKKNYSKLKFKMIGQGKNTYNIGGKMKKPSYKRSKSAPPGFGGSLEEGND
tara:strand:- start:3134 stop:3967 length:834 start_codon:yes stop_codon:yes gene_type:complete